jgi:hypothetical protein
VHRNCRSSFMYLVIHTSYCIIDSIQHTLSQYPTLLTPQHDTSRACGVGVNVLVLIGYGGLAQDIACDCALLNVTSEMRNGGVSICYTGVYRRRKRICISVLQYLPIKPSLVQQVYKPDAIVSASAVVHWRLAPLPISQHPSTHIPTCMPYYLMIGPH